MSNLRDLWEEDDDLDEWLESRYAPSSRPEWSRLSSLVVALVVGVVFWAGVALLAVWAIGAL